MRQVGSSRKIESSLKRLLRSAELNIYHQSFLFVEVHFIVSWLQFTPNFFPYPLDCWKKFGSLYCATKHFKRNWYCYVFQSMVEKSLGGLGTVRRETFSLKKVSQSFIGLCWIQNFWVVSWRTKLTPQIQGVQTSFSQQSQISRRKSGCNVER